MSGLKTLHLQVPPRSGQESMPTTPTTASSGQAQDTGTPTDGSDLEPFLQRFLDAQLDSEKQADADGPEEELPELPPLTDLQEPEAPPGADERPEAEARQSFGFDLTPIQSFAEPGSPALSDARGLSNSAPRRESARVVMQAAALGASGSAVNGQNAVFEVFSGGQMVARVTLPYPATNR